MKLISYTLAGLLAAGGAQAATVTFEGLTNGSELSTFDFGSGLTGTASAVGNYKYAPDAAVVFDTALTVTADPDLQSPFNFADTLDPLDARGFGNAIIIQENDDDVNGIYTPDDDGKGGILEFDFDPMIALGEVYLLDAIVGTTVTLYNGFDVVAELETKINADSGNNPGDNLYTVLDFEGKVGDRFVIETTRSIGLGEFVAETVSPVPLPAGSALMLTGLAGMGIAARRRKAK